MKSLWRAIKRWFGAERNPAPIVIEVPNPPVIPGVTKRRNISSIGIALIIEFEGFSAVPYYDVAGVATIGFGTISYVIGIPVTMRDEPITKDHARFELEVEVNKKCEVLEKTLEKHKLILSQNEFDALCSFSYNLGTGPITSYNSTVNKGIRLHDRNLITNGMLMYDKAKVKNMFGIRVLKPVAGLTRRRVAEVKLFKGEE